MRIGTVELKYGLLLAPMAGVTDLPFRILCEEFGAEMTTTEMVSAKALCFGDKKTAKLLDLTGQKKPVAIQIFGHEPESLYQGTRRALELCAPAAVDINMGCPAPKITSGGDGSAIMRSPERIGEIVAAVREAVPARLPVTVKMRAGYSRDTQNAVLCAREAERGGAAAITVHGKTREQFYAPPVDLSVIAAVKQAVGVPVIGNGEIFSPEDAARMRQKTGCDAVMIGRGACGNPFLFRELQAAAEGRAAPAAALPERLDTALRHIEALVACKGEHIGMLEARKHFAWYIKGLRGACAYKNEANSLTTLAQLRALIDRICREQGGGAADGTDG